MGAYQIIPRKRNRPGEEFDAYEKINIDKVLNNVAKNAGKKKKKSKEYIE